MALQFQNDYARIIRRYKIAEHHDFIQINQTSHSRQITVNADPLFQFLKTDISSEITAMNGKISIVLNRNGTIEQSQTVFIRHLLRRRVSEHNEEKSEKAKIPPLDVQFVRDGYVDPAHYGFEFLINDEVRAMKLNLIHLMFVSNIASNNETNCDLVTVPLEIYPDCDDWCSALDFRVLNGGMTHTIAFGIESLLSVLILHIPSDIMFIEGSIHLSITTASYGTMQVAFPSKSVTIEELIGSLGVKRERIRKLRDEQRKKKQAGSFSFFDSFSFF